MLAWGTEPGVRSGARHGWAAARVGAHLRLGLSDAPELFCLAVFWQSDCTSEFLWNCKGPPPFLGASEAPLNPFRATGLMWAQG